MSKYDEVKNLDVKTIDQKVTEARRQLFNMRMQKKTAGVEKAHLFRSLKKDIARLLTARRNAVKA